MRWLLWLGSMSLGMPMRYRLRWETPPRYTYIVEIVASPSPGRRTLFCLPAWRPGRYILQNYAGAVSHFAAYDEAGRPLPWRKTTKDTWEVQNPARGPIRVSYHFYARQLDAGSSYLAEGLVYFNPVNLFMYIPRRLEEPCELEIPSLPPDWAVATALPRCAPQTFCARSYHHLADSPFLAAPTLRTEKMACEGLTFYVHFYGKVGAQNLSPFLQNICRIIQTQKRIWGGKLPVSEYHFIYLLVPFRLRHAVEHENCAMFVLPEEGAVSEEALRSFLGISAHEFFHLWNVKRLRPAALWPYRYDREVYTSLHWFTEGVTDYYAGLTLLRAGLMEIEEYWRQLSADLSQVENAPVYQLFSPAELSLDSWLATSTYRPPHLQGSFYAAGKRVGFLLDMLLRRETKGKVTLDSLLRYLYAQYYERGKGMPEEAVARAAVRLGGSALAEFFQRFVWGRERPAYSELLAGLPLTVQERRQRLPSWGSIGITRTEPDAEGLKVVDVLPGSLAESAGIEVGDLLLTIEGQPTTQISADFWEDLPSGRILEIGYSRAGFPQTAWLTYDPERLSYRTEIHLRPTDPAFLKEF
ncbi:MAG: PDZ domain-containing protein [Bacteroidia bacterium]|nr:PDZ domain-containing protein [Bacteroidia bacterium]